MNHFLLVFLALLLVQAASATDFCFVSLYRSMNHFLLVFLALLLVQAASATICKYTSPHSLYIKKFNTVSHPTHVSQWCNGSSDQSFMVDPLSYFSFQPVLHDWCNKGCGMCYPVCGMVHIKEPLLLIGKNSPCGGSMFPLSLSEWSFSIRPRPYNRN